jgi:HAE1 family hydrophobic/amphiphilic exporter-1
MYIQMQLPKPLRSEHIGAAKAVENVLMSTPGVKYCTTALGFSLLSLTRSTYNAFFFVTLEPMGRRGRQSRSSIR